MLMLHGLGLEPLLLDKTATTTTTTKTLAPGTCSADGTLIWDAGGFWRRPRIGERCPQPSTTSGCPTGYVMSEFGCVAPSAPSAPCPAGSVQTGYGCLPSTPPSPPPPPAPIPVPQVIPTPQPFEGRLRTCMQPEYSTSAACAKFFAQIEAERDACKADPLHHDCVELVASLARVGYTGPSKAPPGVQVTPVEATPPPAPVQPVKPKISKGMIALGVLGVGAAIAAAVLGNR